MELNLTPMVQKLVLPLRPQMVNVSFTFNEVSFEGFNELDVSNWLKQSVHELGYRSGNLDYIFVSDDFLLDMNKEYLNHDYYTDVITFNFNEENSLIGEIYISVDRVVDNANEFSNGNSILELMRVCIHGVLHLSGLNDESGDEKHIMRMKEDYFLNKLNVSRET